MKPIDADKLYEYLEQVGECYPRYIDNIVDNAISNVIDGIKTFVASLQQDQPEADLDREIIKYKVPFTDEREYLNETTLDAIARHFWNKGYNARNN